MPWLKSEICHAHGYSAPQYTYLGPTDPAAELLEDVKYGIKSGSDGDRDGFREPRWTVLSTLPAEILQRKIVEAENVIRSQESWLNTLRCELTKLSL